MCSSQFVSQFGGGGGGGGGRNNGKKNKTERKFTLFAGNATLCWWEWLSD